MNGIRTTHTGSLPRTEAVLAALVERERGGEGPDPETVRSAVAESVRMQLAAGIDVVNDGESSKISYVTYAADRLAGFAPSEASPAVRNRAMDDFPEFAKRKSEKDAGNVSRRQACVGPVAYRDTAAVETDIEALQAALVDRPEQEAFLTAASPGVIAMFMPDEHYGDRQTYLEAIGDAMKVEYDTIHRAGLLLQVDCPDLAVSRNIFENDDAGLREFRRFAAANLAVLDHALRDIPPARIRMHTCWGNYEGPHNRDVPLRDLIDILFTARAGTLSFEGANPRHEHEWELFSEFELPAEKRIMPGVVDSTTNYVEHPQVVAQRVERYARLVGPDRVIASTDCGMATFAAGTDGVDARIAWAKLRSLVEGAELARKPRGNLAR
ncbi:cobalamin-independent methionine synthase II family protein [Pseudonocardia sp. TRM90224]|uniref:cobalamin-independent methionine synthase II family protein n=1 Tax=Pseudonocardia sp. TRM90224 TaxID=2812678 RepID=UPI001E52E29E|nr:cobalamin-independent methionine synthase II family protein [Pseudonocardia sp. TRM90224]